MLRLWAWWPWAESPMVCSLGQSDRRERRPGCMPIYLAAATRHRCVLARHPTMWGPSLRRRSLRSLCRRLYNVGLSAHCPTYGRLPSLFTLSLFTLSGMDKWAEGPMVCSPGQSDRRERRPGCMPIYLAAATRQWVYHGSSSYHVPPLPTAALPSVALPQGRRCDNQYSPLSTISRRDNTKVLALASVPAGRAASHKGKARNGWRGQREDGIP